MQASFSMRWNRPCMTGGPCIVTGSCITATGAANLGSTGRRNACVRCLECQVECLGRCSPAKRLARPAVEGCGHRQKVVYSVRAQVRALREVLSQQPIGILVRSSLPRAVRLAEVDVQAGINPQLCVLAHLRPLVPGQRTSEL